MCFLQALYTSISAIQFFFSHAKIMVEKKTQREREVETEAFHSMAPNILSLLQEAINMIRLSLLIPQSAHVYS